MTPRIVEVRTRILKRNDEIARDLRTRFTAAGVRVFDLVSSPGAGKTELLVRTLTELRDRFRCAAVVGDLATDHDARRLASSGVPARQIETGGVCHLEAEMVARAIDGWQLNALDYLFIENVGNLVCPASWDLGAHQRVLLQAVTEGEEKPLKYPTLIHTCDLVILTKADLADAVDFDEPLARRNITAARPGCPVLRLSARSGEGVSSWIEFVLNRRAPKRT